MQHLKHALTGAVVGVIVGPLGGGLTGFLILSLSWFVQSYIWADSQRADIIPLAALFGVLIAPLGASIGAVVGTIIGMFGYGFGSWINAGSFGGLVGAAIGLAAAPNLFGGQGGDLTAAVAAVFTMAITGMAVALAVKWVQRRRALTS